MQALRSGCHQLLQLAEIPMKDNTIPALASMVLPRVAELVLQHVRSTPSLPVLAEKPPFRPSSATSAAPAVVGAPAGADEVS